MPFSIIRNDITRVKADAIVNTANPRPVIGAGTDSAIYQAAGADKLLAEREKIGSIPVGKAAATSAFDLDAKYIIHTVGPAWRDGKHGEEAALRSCYEESLKLAISLNCESIAFPLISAGTYGFPTDLAIRTATGAIYDFLMENDMMVYLVVFGRRAYDLSGKLFSDVNSYIDEHYVSAAREREYGHPMSNASYMSGAPVNGSGAYNMPDAYQAPDAHKAPGAPKATGVPKHSKRREGILGEIFNRRRRAQEEAYWKEMAEAEAASFNAPDSAIMPDYAPAPDDAIMSDEATTPEDDSFSKPVYHSATAGSSVPQVKPAGSSAVQIKPAGTLEDHIKATDESFQEYLLKLIIKKDLKNSDVYRKANLSKQHFSKMISNRDYHPTKNTVCALALSLQLNLDETNALLEKAGFALSHSSKFDLAIEYFVLNKMYNVVDNNVELYECGLETLGQQPPIN